MSVANYQKIIFTVDYTESELLQYKQQLCLQNAKDRTKLEKATRFQRFDDIGMPIGNHALVNLKVPV